MSEEKVPEEVLSTSPGVQFEPVMRLPAVDIKTLEEDEQELFKMRARLYRFDTSVEPPEWKERGTGDVKLLFNCDKSLVRLLMRREKTFKICANHNISPFMELKQHASSDRAWVWSVPADFADEEPKPELLAIRFATSENALRFHGKFEEAKELSAKKLEGSLDEDAKPTENANEDDLTNKLGDLSVADAGDTGASETETQTASKDNSQVDESSPEVTADVTAPPDKKEDKPEADQ